MKAPQKSSHIKEIIQKYFKVLILKLEIACTVFKELNLSYIELRNQQHHTIKEFLRKHVYDSRYFSLFFVSISIEMNIIVTKV